MTIIPGDVIIEPATNRQTPPSQPVEALANLDPVLDDAAVRQAIVSAEANNQDPQTLKLSEIAQAPVENPVVPPLSKPPEVPQKFLKLDGEVDVEKIQASTRQLDEALANREPVPQKTVDDYLAEYREKEKLFRSGTVPKAPDVAVSPPVPQGNLSPHEFEEIVRRDYAADPLATTTRLLDLMLAQKLAPLEEREKVEVTRTNLQALAAKDSRILRDDVYKAVNAKLASDPDYWKLKNPHKAAWLEVKEEMRLGEPPSNGVGSAQPSRSSPVLGGGTPPSSPSTSVQSPLTSVAALNTLDLRDKKQEAAGDEAIRALLASNR